MTHNAHAPYLFATRHGRVFRCVCCGRLQVEFANLVLPLDRACFEQLERRLNEAARDERQNDWCWLEAATDAGPIRVPMQAEGIAAFHRLLRGARAMLRLEDRLRATAAGEHFGTVLGPSTHDRP